jgi:hypothetical protein
MRTTGSRILFEAEPFGYGPAAMAAAVARELKPYLGEMNFLGIRHTSDLQRGVGYDRVWHFDQLPPRDEARAIIARHTAVVTTMDWWCAEIAVEEGIPVIFLDALLWFWRSIPPMAHEFAMHIAQDFYGVRRAAEEHRSLLSERTVIVPPFTSPRERKYPSDWNLLNLGGLQNPSFSDSIVDQYASALAEALGGDSTPWRLLGNRRLAAAFPEWGLLSVTPEGAVNLLAESRAALMTGGLGNIFDAASLGSVPVLWLPPMNDSQGQQLELLEAHGALDARIDWSDIDGSRIDYRAPQRQVLEEIARSVQRLGTPAHRERCVSLVREKTATLAPGTSRTRRVLQDLGSGGLRLVIEMLAETFST